MNIKHTGWEEMLEQQERKALAVSYVRGGFFGKKLRDWARRDSGSGLETSWRVLGEIGFSCLSRW